MSLRSLMGGFQHVRNDPVILGTIALDMCAVFLAGAGALFPIFARDILKTGPWGLGLLRAAPAVGALAMSLLLARRPLTIPIGPVLFGVISVFGLATIVFALSTHLLVSLAALAVLGAADVVSVVIRFSLVQLRTPAEMRGRVSAVNGMFTGTSNYLGDFRAGAVAALVGAPLAVAFGGAGVFLVVALWWFLFPAVAAYPFAGRGDRGESRPRRRNRDAMTEAEAPVQAPPKPGKGVQTVSVGPDEDGMRLDRFFEARYPGLSFSHIQRIIRKGEVRVNGKRAQPKDRLQKGQAIRIPPLKIEPPKPRDDAPGGQKDRAFIKSITLYEDDDVLVLEQADGARGAGRLGHLSASRRHAGLDDRQGRPAAAPRAPARQGYLRLPAGRQDPVCRDCACENIPHPLGAQDLLGPGRGRAAAEAGPGFDLPRQGRPRG